MSSNVGGIKDEEYIVSPFATVMYTYKKERFPIPAFFFTDPYVLDDFIFENRYAETLDFSTLTENQKDDYYFEFVMHYLPKGFLEQLGSPLQLIVGAIIGIFAAGLLAPLKVALIALDIGSIGFDGYQGVMLIIEASKTRKTASSIREVKESARLMASGVAKLTMQVVNTILSFASSRKGKYDGLSKEQQMQADTSIIQQKKEVNAGTPEHKELRWKNYQEAGGEWNYERWSKTYENNMLRATKANEAVDRYHNTINWGKREVTVDISLDKKNISRRLDIADIDLQQGIEYKTGYAYASEEILWEVTRDSELVKNGWDITWIIQGRISGPLEQLLLKNHIKVIKR